MRHIKNHNGCRKTKVVYLEDVICEPRQHKNGGKVPKRPSLLGATGANVVPMKETKAYGAIRKGVPHNLRRIRQERGLTIAELAALLGVEPTTVQRYETQPQRLRVYQLSELASALECTVVDLVSDEPALTDIQAQVLDELNGVPEEEQARILDVVRAMVGRGSGGRAA